jgi:hypothetical protein
MIRLQILLGAFTVIIGLGLSNFVFQYFDDKNYLLAFERSFFQLIAILAFIYWLWLNDCGSKTN